MKLRIVEALLCVFFGVLVAWLFLPFNRSKTVEVVEKRVIDTLFQTKYDTLTIYENKYISKLVVDTVYIASNKDSLVSIPIAAYHYRKENLYDVWASGYNVSLDSILVYPATKYITTKEYVERKEYIETRNLYFLTGFKGFSSQKLPTIGLLYKTRRNALFSAEIGVDSDNNTFYGINIGFKIK